jgi:hypothetical protein
MDTEVVDNPSEHRFELPIGGALAVAYYHEAGGRIAPIPRCRRSFPAAASARSWRGAYSSICGGEVRGS